MAFDARAVANFLLDYAEKKQLRFSLLALMKVIYFAHGWYLAKHDSALVKQRFEAWENGPVVRVVWEAFRGKGAEPIVSRARRLDVASNVSSTVEYEFPPDIESFLRSVCDAYTQLHAYELSRMTHEVGSPWDQVWNSISGQVSVGMPISDESIREWFVDRRRFELLH